MSEEKGKKPAKPATDPAQLDCLEVPEGTIHNDRSMKRQLRRRPPAAPSPEEAYDAKDEELPF